MMQTSQMQPSQMQQGQASQPIQPPPSVAPASSQVPTVNPVQYQAQPAPAPVNQQQQQQQQHQSHGQVFGTQQVRPAVQGQQPQQPNQAQVYNGAAQQQQQQQQHISHHGLNGGWQSDKDYPDRKKMIAKIVHLLQQRKPNAPQDWLKKLPQMAKRLEESLYRSAKSFEEYNDATTLKNRLQQLAVHIGMKKNRTAPQQMMQAQPNQSGQGPTPNGQPMQYMRQPGPPQNTGIQQQQQQQPQRAPTSVQQPGSVPNQQQVVNMADINPMMSQQQQQQPQAMAPSSAQSQPMQPAASIPSTIQPVNYSAQPQSAQVAANTITPSVAANGSSIANNRQMSDRNQVLRHQQQRLLLLRHAAKCVHEDGKCPVTPHCAGMKRLWKHIAECKDQKCTVPHCVSSRYVLSHYHRCKDVKCPVCGPVREAIHRSHEKQKQMQALKERHQQAVQQQGDQPMPLISSALPPPGHQSSEPPNKRMKVAAGRPPSAIQISQPMVSSSGVLPQAHLSSTVQPPGLVSSPTASAIQPHLAGSAGKAQVSSAPGIAFANGQVIMPKHTGPKSQEDHTLINCFTIEQIETHIASLSNGLVLSPQRLKTKCLDVLKSLQTHQHAWVFNTPVDPVGLGLDDYFEVIKKPMDLGTIRKKLDNGVYTKIDEFEEHVILTFDNAMLYNPEGSVVYNMASEMKDQFAIDYQKMLDQLNIEEDIKRRNGEACLLCGCEKLLFEPPVFYCNGLNCPSKRIRRNSFYYVGGNNQYHWCHQCFQELRDSATIDLGDISVRKEQLVKKKNDEVHEESWVQCDRCERWVHQICALFNTRQNKDQSSEYTCPKCTLDERKRLNQYAPVSTTPMAEDLPRTKLSEALENHVRVKVTEFLEKKAKDLSISTGCSLDEAAKRVQMGGDITIRQVTSMDRRLEVRDRMKKRYAFKNYPDEFNFRCKCIVVFQNLDGVDVILFGLYVYEHDEKNPAPNTRTVYVSYLDSVHFMRPREMRTFIYHEILISYLDYVRKRGFASAHIWACPPLKGDDYILYAKPEDQKTPKDDRLRQWYIDMLIECQRRGVVGKLTNMYDLYFSKEKNDATVVPYMDGDYFPAEVENIIKDIEEGKVGKKSSSQGKKKEKQKKKSGRGGTRSTGIDEDALKASGIVPPGKDAKSLEEGARDYVMLKLGETIQPMKESFIVAYLAWEHAREEDMDVPADIERYRKQHGITWRLPPSEKDSTENGNSANSDDNKDDNNASESDKGSTDAKSANGDRMESEIKKEDDDGSTQPDKNGSSSVTSANSVKLSIREGKFAAMAARKRDLEGEPKEPEKVKSKKEDKTLTVKDSKGRIVKVLDDDEEELDCEFLNNRQAFLNLCQGNHYQFDHLRRAKHTSMMVLWHLHNRDAPKFVQQCATCSREILSGYRYHCPTCPDYDQCQDCYKNPAIAAHIHALKPVNVSSKQQNEMSEQQREERRRNVNLHMTLLLHATTCTAAKCRSENCTKMKGLLKHGMQCTVKAAGGCSICLRIRALLQIHARQCKADKCPVHNCIAIRERFRQLKQQQQAMDDRRRQEMNRAYHSKR